MKKAKKIFINSDAIRGLCNPLTNSKLVHSICSTDEEVVNEEDLCRIQIMRIQHRTDSLRAYTSDELLWDYTMDLELISIIRKMVSRLN